MAGNKMKTGNVIGIDAVAGGMAERVSQWLEDLPCGGIVAAVTYLDTVTGFSTTHFANLNCGPADLLAIADTLLARASERFAAHPEDADHAELHRRVEQARVVLDLVELHNGGSA